MSAWRSSANSTACWCSTTASRWRSTPGRSFTDFRAAREARDHAWTYARLMEVADGPAVTEEVADGPAVSA